MIHYLIIGHAAFEEAESRVCVVQGEQPNNYLEKKFIKQIREDWDYDSDKEVYVDFILKSNSPIEVQYG